MRKRQTLIQLMTEPLRETNIQQHNEANKEWLYIKETDEQKCVAIQETSKNQVLHLTVGVTVF